MEKQIFVTNSVTQSSDKDLEGVGTLRWVGDKLYRWVKNAESSTALNQGDIACYNIDGLNTFTQVKKPATAILNAVAGVVASKSIAAGSYGWVQVIGLAQIKVKGYSQTTTYASGAYLAARNGEVFADSADAVTQPDNVAWAIKDLGALATHTNYQTTPLTTRTVMVMAI